MQLDARGWHLRHDLANHGRRVAAIGEMKFPRATFAFHRSDAREPRQRRHIGVRVQGLQVHDTRVVLRADLRNRLVEHLRALIDHHDSVTECLGLRHHVRGKNDRSAALVLSQDQVTQQTHVHRIEPAERFVEDEQIRLVQHAGEELDLLLHALRELLTLLVGDVAELDRLQPALYTRLEDSAWHTLESPDVHEKGRDLHLLVDAALFGQVSDPVFGFQRGIATQHRDRTRVRQQDRHDDANGRGLARTVGADEAAHRSCGDGEVEVAYGYGLAKGLRDVANDDCVSCRQRSRSPTSDPGIPRPAICTTMYC